MKDVTITAGEETARWAKVQAARHDTSVSRMPGEELRRIMERERNYERAKAWFFAKALLKLKKPDYRYPARETLYER